MKIYYKKGEKKMSLNEYKDYELKIDDFTSIDVKFENNYTKKEIKLILTEIKNAINYVFGKYYDCPNIKIIVVNELKVNGYIINGKADLRKQEVKIATKTINTNSKLRNCICHELVHIKFGFDNLNKIVEIINGNIAMYYINEFWACKISKDYSYVADEANVFKSLDLDKEVERISTSSIEDKKILAGAICMCILENDLINNVLKSNKKYLNLRSKIEKIGFLPTEKDISDIKNELVNLKLI